MNEIICADCLEVLKSMPDKSVDLVLTDPPYGIEYVGGLPNSNQFDAIENDAVGDIDYHVVMSELCRVGKQVIVFGANNFYADLPHKGSWICWDKRCSVQADKMFGAPFELAWLDKENQGSGGVGMYRVQHGGVVNADRANERRLHPTQKPIELMRQIINDYSEAGDTILDPFAGSGTTCVAAKILGRKYIGIEISPVYAEIARKRVEQAQYEERLFAVTA